MTLNRRDALLAMAVLSQQPLHAETTPSTTPAKPMTTAAATARRTHISIEGTKFFINGKPTYAGRVWKGKPIEGLLMNSRMVQAIYDDRNPETADMWAYADTGKWDAQRNTREFIAEMPFWREHGLLGLAMNLQGGSPQGYSKSQPWHNSALNADGSLDPAYMQRLAQILDEADKLGMVAILGIYYFGQDQRLNDEAAVIAGVDATVDWIVAKGYRNVTIEINNECDIAYDHDILRPARVHELILRAKERSKAKGLPLLVSTSYSGGNLPRTDVLKASDFALLHGNGVSNAERIPQMVQLTREIEGYRPMPIVFNEDDHYNFEEPENNFANAVAEYASWGFFDFRRNGEGFEEGYQSVPVNWKTVSDRKKGFYKLMKEMTGGL
jgi:hypothetical protein